ncbi:MAG: hypothetical protein HQL73_09100 [Magnetococcales bacterium]|nr:hypothetical protein [Magnetococcales bacterium]
MPKIINFLLYNLIYKTSYKMLQSKPLISKFLINMNKGMALYRYTGYRNSQPQYEDSGRIIWTSLQNDINNRWSGLGADGQGSQALYLSVEKPGPGNTSFPELEHYQDANIPATELVRYFEYQAGKQPQWTTAKASELRSMFLFNLGVNLAGLDLTYQIAQDSLLTHIYETAKQTDPSLFTPQDTLEKLYFNPDDASFNRALGNAAFSIPDLLYIKTTSVRDKKSVNVAMLGKRGVPVSSLQPLGRGTFFLDGTTKQSKGVVTIDDMIYNERFEQVDTPYLPPIKDIQTDLAPLSKRADSLKAGMDWTYAQTMIDSSVSKYVLESLQGMDNPFAQPIDTLVSSMNTEALNQIVLKNVNDYTLLNASSQPVYAEIVQLVGESGAQNLLSAEIAQPRFEAISVSPGSGRESYLSAALRQTLLAQKKHWLSQNASSIQERLAQADTHLSETRSEIVSKNNALEEINKQLASKPSDPDLLKQSQALQKEIADLVAKEKQMEEEQKQAESDQEENERDSKETEDERRRAEEEMKARGKDIFKGGK